MVSSKTSNRPRFGPPYITPEEKDIVVLLYLNCKQLKVKQIASIMNIDVTSLYDILREKGIKANRLPGVGNFTNHPTKFEAALHKASVNQLTGGDD